MKEIRENTLKDKAFVILHCGIVQGEQRIYVFQKFKCLGWFSCLYSYCEYRHYRLDMGIMKHYKPP